MSATSVYSDRKAVTWRRTYKEFGYELRREIVDGSTYGGKDVAITSAYTDDGSYIGNSRMARFLCQKMQIAPKLRTKTSNTCSIGRGKDGKWYGWSHRAICGFKVGDKLYDDNFGSHLPGEERDNIPWVKHGRKTIRNLKEARLAACRFAESVS